MKPIENARIFLVDDDAINLKVLAAALRSSGFANLVSIQNPRRVVAEHRKDPADLIFLDLNMPDMDGFAVLQAMNDPAHPPFPPVVVLTGHVDQAIIDRAKSAGAREYIAKPFDLGCLLVLTRKMLA